MSPRLFLGAMTSSFSVFVDGCENENENGKRNDVHVGRISFTVRG